MVPRPVLSIGRVTTYKALKQMKESECRSVVSDALGPHGL